MYKLKIGNATVEEAFSPVEGTNGQQEMVYFNLNDTKYVPIVDETCRLIAESIKGPKSDTIIVCPEAAPLAIAYVLRTRYQLQVQNMSKSRRPNMGIDTLEENYSAATSTKVKGLYFNGFDEGILYSSASRIVIFDNVVTTAETMRAAYRLLRRFDPKMSIESAIVMFTEGLSPFGEISVDNGEVLKIYSLGGHIPLRMVSDDAQQQQQQQEFFFKSSARFATHYDTEKKVYFCVFEDAQHKPAIGVVGPGTFSKHKDHEGIPVRVHDQCMTSECFHSVKCDCREQLDLGMKRICDPNGDGGILIYLFQEGRGIGLSSKIKAYFLQEMSLHDTVEANRVLGLPDDARTYQACRDILSYMKVKSIQLITNNPRKIECLKSIGVNVIGRIPCYVPPTTKECRKYLADKISFMSHEIEDDLLKGKLEESTKIVEFYEPDEENGFLSNFYPTPNLVIDHVRYTTTEHYYQSQKFAWSEGIDVSELIKQAKTPEEAFALTRVEEHRKLQRPDWDLHKKRTMFRALIFKFKQHPELRKQLLDTGEAHLIEKSPKDSYWGCGADGDGENTLGRMLENIRDALQDHVFDPDNPLE